MDFDESLHFLAELNLVAFNEEIIERTDEFQQLIDQVGQEKSLAVQYIVKQMLNANNQISKSVQEYFSKFSLKGDDLIYKPIAKIRRKESGIRNLLIDFGILGYSDSEKFYYITDEYLPLFVKKSQGIYQSPNELEYLLKKQKELGSAAELVILGYEKKRLENNPKLVAEVQHISQRNVNAGYDIKSSELESSEENPIIRYIEVKAISLTDFRFFWSRNEIKVAKYYGERYYLYLLPVLSQGTFDIFKIAIISNAYKNVFLCSNTWRKTEELYSFSKDPRI